MSTFKKLGKGESVTDDRATELLLALEVEPTGTAINHLQNRIESSKRYALPRSIRNIEICLATVQGSKGLSGDLVFVTHFDDTPYFISKKPTGEPPISDQEVCNFIVALTRTKQKAYLVSTQKKEQTFLKWISNDHIDLVTIGKAASG